MRNIMAVVASMVADFTGVASMVVDFTAVDSMAADFTEAEVDTGHG
jgi:butyrate kinase